MKVLGVDYGQKKIGLAIGQTETGLADPVETLFNFNFLIFDKFVKENKIGLVVIGLPDGEMDKEIKDFGRKIERQTGLPVEFYDETLTTKEARKVMGQSGKNRRYQKNNEDAVSAALMVESFLKGFSRKEENV